MRRDVKNIVGAISQEGIGKIVSQVLLCALIGLFSLVSSTANAAEPYTHDGFHLRFGVGVVAGWKTAEDGEFSVENGGPGVVDGVQIGGSLKQNLSVFFEADSLTLFSMDNNRTSKGDVKTNHAYFTGLGIGRYLMPANIYISGAIGVSYNNVIFGDRVEFNSKDLGLGLTMMAGKEWWVSEICSMGFGAQVLYMANIDSKTSSAGAQTIATGIILTASFN